MLRIFVGGGRSVLFELSLNMADSFTRKMSMQYMPTAST